MHRHRYLALVLVLLCLSVAISVEAQKVSIFESALHSKIDGRFASLGVAQEATNEEASDSIEFGAQSRLVDGSRRPFLRDSGTTNELVLNMDDTWTNQTFSSWLCGNLTSGVKYHELRVSVSPQSSSSSLVFLLPPCFFDISLSLTSATFDRVVIYGNSTSSTSHPLVRLAKSLDFGATLSSESSLKSLTISNSILADASGNSVDVDWTNTFASLPSLTSLSITTCHLRGSLPSSIPAILYSFDLSRNKLSGSLSASLLSLIDSQSTHLELNLSYNNLSGTIPASLLLKPLQIPSLSTFSLSLASNQLSGAIPSIPTSIGTITTFSLDLSANSLSGDLTMVAGLSMNRATSVKFNLASNLFSGSLPSNLFAFAFKRTSLYPITTTMSLASNALSGTIPEELFSMVDWSMTQSFLCDFSSNKLSGNLPSVLMNYSSAPYIDTVELNLIANALLSGSIPSSFLYSINPIPLNSYNIRAARDPTVNVRLLISGTLLKGDLEIPDFTDRLSIGGVRLTIFGYRSYFSKLIMHPNSSQGLYYLDVTGSAKLTGTLPKSLFNSESVLQYLYASQTNLTGHMPDLGSLGAIKLKVMDLGSTEIDFCAGSRLSWRPTDLISCILTSTSASLCPAIYPPQCSITSSPSNPIPFSSGPPPCPESTRPNIAFTCLNGHWTFNATYTPDSLTIPGGATEIIVGNLSSSEVTFKGPGSTLVVIGCASNLKTVNLLLSQEELRGMRHDFVQSLVATDDHSPKCASLERVQVNIRLAEDGCRKPRPKKLTASGRLSVAVSVNQSSCRNRWIILVSVLSAVALILVVIFVLLVVFKRPHSKNVEAYSKHATTDVRSSNL